MKKEYKLILNKEDKYITHLYEKDSTPVPLGIRSSTSRDITERVRSYVDISKKVLTENEQINEICLKINI